MSVAAWAVVFIVKQVFALISMYNCVEGIASTHSVYCTFSFPHKFFFLKYFIKSSLSQYCYDFSQQQLQLPFQRWFCAALCPRQCASGCCAQPLPPFGLSSLTLPLLFSALSSAAVSALITMLCGKVASQEVAVSSSCVPHGNPQLQTGLSVFSGRQQIGLFGSVFPPDFCISLRHGASMSH